MIKASEIYEIKKDVESLQKEAVKHKHSKNDITDFPTEMKAKGGDADTLQGYSPSDFLSSRGGTVRGNITASGGNFYTNQYLQLEARNGLGAGVASLYYNSTNNAKILEANNIKDIALEDNKVYHEGRKPLAVDILFSDGESFEDKLKLGKLKGEPGEKGNDGANGPKGDKGEKGNNGNDGLTTSIVVNGATCNHSSGRITLPNYPTLSSLGAAAASHDHSNFMKIRTLETENLNDLQTIGIYCQNRNVNTPGKNYPENNAGCLIITEGAGWQQRYHVYDSTRIYVRAKYGDGAWTPWAREYNTANKPSPSDIGAAPSSHTHGYIAPGGTYDTVTFNNWIRTTGNTGWYNASHGGGMYMTDSTWVKVSHGKALRCDGTIRGRSIESDGDVWTNSHNKAANGHCKLTNGLIIQWGEVNVGTSTINVNFPIAFPNNALSVVVSPRATTSQYANLGGAPTRTSFPVRSSYSTLYTYWIAVGY